MSTTANFQKLQRSFTNYLRDPEHQPVPDNIEPRRMAIYEELVFNNIEGFLSNGFPVIRSLFERSQWNEIVRGFICHHQCHSPLFSEITLEFIDYLSAKGRYLLDDYPFLIELAHYEWVEVSVIYADEENATADEIVSQQEISDEEWLSFIPRKSSIMHLLAYEYPVHSISKDNIPEVKTAAGNFLTVYRNHQDEVGFMQLNAVSYRLIESIDGHITGKQLIDNLAEEMGYAQGSQLYPQAIEMLRGFTQRNILLGAFNVK